jgi:tetratricopeptide (TPR) repeat protein
MRTDGGGVVRRRERAEAKPLKLPVRECILLVVFLAIQASCFMTQAPARRSVHPSINTGSVHLRFARRRLFLSRMPIPQVYLPTLSASIAKSTSPADRSPDYASNRSLSKKRKRNTKRYEIRQLFQKAKDLERKGHWRKAADVLNEILVWDPADAHSHLALSRLEGRRFPDTNKACEAFGKGTEACPNSVHLWQAWAVHEDSSGHVDRARELFEKALAIDPHNPYVCHAFGLMERKLGNVESAKKLWALALQKKSTAALVCQMGELFIAENQLDQTRELYSKHLLRLETAKDRTEVYLAAAWLEERYFTNYIKAEELIKSALALNPSSSVAHVALARLEGRNRQRIRGEGYESATARRLASACISLETEGNTVQPDDGRVFNAWAHIEIKGRRFSSARNILRRGLSRYPEDYSLLQAAGILEERVGNYTGARAIYGKSLRIQPAAPTLVAYALLDLRHPSSGEANFTRVKALFEEAILLDPRHGPAYNSYGNLELRQGNIRTARNIFERGILAHCSDVASVYHGYARLELSIGNVKKAREILVDGIREACQQDAGMDSPHRERALFLSHTLGMLELNSNRPIDALSIFIDGVNRYGNSSQLLLGAALCEVKLGNEVNARMLFERSLLVDEKHPQAWQAWGVMELRAGNTLTAQTLFECGIKAAPKHGALWLAYAISEGRLGNPETARSLFANGIKHSPRHIPLYQAWASLELREANYNAAKALISEALTRDKRNGSGWLVAAEIEKSLGNAGLVNLILRRGIECAPTNAELYRALGDSLLQRGNVLEAREIFEKGIDVDPLHAPLYHSLAELEARIFNVEGLSKLNARATKVFKTNALEPPSTAGDEAWGTKIRAGRLRSTPTGVKALAERIVEDDTSDLLLNNTNLDLFIESISESLMEDGLVGQLFNMEMDRIEIDSDVAKT